MNQVLLTGIQESLQLKSSKSTTVIDFSCISTSNAARVKWQKNPAICRSQNYPVL